MPCIYDKVAVYIIMWLSLDFILVLYICCGIQNVATKLQEITFDHGSKPCPKVIDICATFVEKTSSSCQAVSLNSTAYNGFQCVVIRDDCLNATLELLPINITNLQLTVNMLPGENVSFRRFSASLRRLEILWTGKIEEIILSNKNNLSNPDLFKGLHNLESLAVNIPTNDMHANLLYDLDLLKGLDLSNTGALSSAKLARLYIKSRLSLKPLKCLILRRMSGVGSSRDRLFMMKDLLSVVQESQLEVLDISHNKDVYLYPGLTNSVPYLENFSLAGNALRYIDDPLMASCMIVEIFLHKNLKKANFDDIGPFADPIAIIQNTFLGQLKKWHSVCKTLQSVCGQFLPKGTVYNCSNLLTYTFTDMISPYCPTNAALPLPQNIHTFKCSRAQFEFRFVKYGNKTICISDNQLRSLDVSHTKFHLAENSYHIVGLDKLEVFNISNSDWGYFFHDPVFLHNFPALHVLDLTATNVGLYINNDTNSVIFNSSANLTNLYLKQAKINHIPVREFQELANLEILDISRNDLQTITFDIVNLTSLKVLDLSGNSFYQLSDGFVARLNVFANKNPLQIDLQYNKLVCSCDYLNSLEWLMSQSIVRFTRQEEYLCTYRNLGRVKMSSIDFSALTTNCYLVYIVVGSLSALFLVIVLAISLCYYYRWRLRLFALKLINYKNRKDDEVFEYDGFVVYADQDRYFVHTTLLEKVENDMEMKLCIHHRDFVPGHGIDENIVNAIDKSRRTLLILTEAFLKSNWCEYEMSVARNKLPVEGRDVIVPILLAELPKEKITPSIKNILRERTYLKWETSLEGQEYFWKKLDISLRKKREKKKIHSSDSYDLTCPLIQPTEDYMTTL